VGGFIMSHALNILAYAIKREEEGEKFYKDNLQRVTSKETRAVMESLAEMEKEHAELLQGRYKTLKEKGQWLPFNDGVQSGSIFQKRFEAEKTTQADLESDLSDITILRMAYLIENDLAEFYKKASEKIENPEGKRLFLTLSHWEVEHKNALYKLYQEHFHNSWFDAEFAPF
jgi:rubrerythrin